MDQSNPPRRTNPRGRKPNRPLRMNYPKGLTKEESRVLNSHLPVWSFYGPEEPDMLVGCVQTSEELRALLADVRQRKRLVRGLEHSTKALSGEKKGLMMLRDKTGQQLAPRPNRLLLLAQDASERLLKDLWRLHYRQYPLVALLELPLSSAEFSEFVIGKPGNTRVALVQERLAVKAIFQLAAMQLAPDEASSAEASEG